MKLACLRLLAKLQLDPARRQLVSGFIDSYIELTMEEDKQLGEVLQQLRPQEKENVMEIVTSWMKKGLEEGLERERKLVLRMLRKQVGDLDPALEAAIATLSADRLEELGEALLDFKSLADLDAWLDVHR